MTHIRVPANLTEGMLKQTTKEVRLLLDFRRAIVWNKPKDIEKLLNTYPLRFTVSDWMSLASRFGFLDVLQYLVNRGEDLDKVSGSFLVKNAVFYGQLEIMEYLAGLELNDKTQHYYIPALESGIDSLIYKAVQSSWMDERSACRMIQLLLDKGEPVNGHGKYSPLALAEVLDKTVIVDFLKKKIGHPMLRSEEKFCDDMPAPLRPHDHSAEPRGACGYSPLPSAPPAYGSLEYRLSRPGTSNFDPPPSYEESTRIVCEKSPE
ncbi:hypothetical protein [Endozoicomonas sp. ONNA2]|uniref:hypothetical protein n=1 Tax=Endozoicomonas sp. ONNA2 TaxID=2828741 RepID=UPI0021495B11|nr:hypothetical protein [Endozoicomonas sp. ONNA2]